MINGPEPEHEKAEILIIRRGHGDDHAAHKGGAWKIAYADFVTAMMAFFLVMWLINSANEATRARVASYFNPIKMTDAQPSEKGINDPTQNKKSSGAGGSASGEKAANDAQPKPTTPAEQAKAVAEKREEQLMQNPYKALDVLSTEGNGNPSGRMVDVPSEKSGDPFDPKAWEALRQGSQTAEVGEAPKSSATDQSGAEKQQALADKSGRVDATLDLKPKTPGLAAERSTAQTDIGGTKKALDGTENLPEQGVAKVTPPAASPGKEAEAQPKAETQAAKAGEAQAQAKVDAARDKIMQAAQRAGVAESLAISVKMTAEGMLISLADKTGDSMFEIGSAAPSPALVALVGTIGTLLESEEGKIVIRGHTDARQYKNLKFDNWQLSTSRAHMASYMLMRGGLAEDRILKIEGYGSTSLINESDPFAAENRRVEFLLKQ